MHAPAPLDTEASAVPIEKAFAMNASANDVYAALQRDIASASAYEGDTYEVLQRERDALIELRLSIGGIPGTLTYTINERESDTEVIASFEPQGWRWIAYNIATLGMRRNSIEMVLVQGLVNLKAEVEDDLEGVDTQQETPATSP